jgi:hypothetical protein
MSKQEDYIKNENKLKQLRKEQIKLINININNLATVKLTSYGFKVYRDYFTLFNSEHYTYFLSKVDENLNFTSELWDIMNIFGSKIYNGSEQVFERNEIIIRKE